MNPITRDAALADDLITTDDRFENIGRFGPMVAGELNRSPRILRRTKTHMGGRSTFLSVFSAIHSPDDQFLPMVDPTPDPYSRTATSYADPYPSNGSFSSNFIYKNWYWDASASRLFLAGASQPSHPDPITPSLVAGGTRPVDGLININTAPWRVLAAVPWKAPDGTNNVISGWPKLMVRSPRTS